MTEENQPLTEQPRRRRSGIFLVIMVMLLVLIAMGSYGYIEVNQYYATFSKKMADQQALHQEEMERLQKSVSDMQQVLQQLQTVTAQTPQQADTDKWYFAEAQYLVSLANDHLQYSHNSQLALALLQQADKALQNNQDTKFAELRQALTADVTKLQTAAAVDLPALYGKLDALNKKVDQLPLQAYPIKSTQEASTIPENQTWWQKGLSYSKEALSKIVVVQRTDAQTLPLVMPESKLYLYQNLHAQLENAIWAVLHQQENVYQASLERVTTWVKRYFVQDAAETKAFLEECEALQKVTIQPQTVDLSETLRLFEASK